METLISVLYFVVFALSMLAILGLTKKGNAFWAEIRSEKLIVLILFVFLIIIAGISFILLIIFTLLDQLLWLRYDDWFFNLVIGLPFFSVIIALFLFFLGNITVDDEIKDRAEVSGKPAGKRPWYFYLLFLILALVPLLCVFIFYGFDAKTLLGRFPVGLAISSLFADIILSGILWKVSTGKNIWMLILMSGF